jgi:selenobiotic family peptide radical SAM maturase
VTDSFNRLIDEVFPVSSSMIDKGIREGIMKEYSADRGPERFPEILSEDINQNGLPGYLPDLARIELAFYQVRQSIDNIPPSVEKLEVNPSLKLMDVKWKNLPLILTSKDPEKTIIPERGEEYIMIWHDTARDRTNICSASDSDLLVLKIVVEGLEPEEVAKAGGLTVGVIDQAIDRAVNRGVLLKPPSRIRRDAEIFHAIKNTGEDFLATDVFTLQWHITQSCDLHCKHCYDRSDRSPMSLEKAIEILDDMRSFCRSRNVSGHISFTGGNPLLYPKFNELYRAAAERGFSIAILGNAAPRERVAELIRIQMPSHYQVSLEGLEEHNDSIRGKGYYRKVMEFLPVLRELGVYSMVMLTLTRDNMEQIIPLAEELRDICDSFTFNRLSLVGEGANLYLPDRDEYRSFLEKYIEAARENPVMRLKDNLINIIRHEQGQKPFGGCAGFGCGAAFNFITVLPDGEVHACRKFPSYIGNIFEKSIEEIYEDESARKYRSGSKECRDCKIRPVCGGCLAVAYSFGLDVYEEKDPFCFMSADRK